MSSINHINKIYILIYTLSTIFFLLEGYAYPATGDDIESHLCNGDIERGVFTQFMTSIAFTLSMALLGFFFNSTFLRYGVKNWNVFSLGIYLMFLYGLGKMGELMFDHELFGKIKDLTLAAALIVITYALYKISNDFKGGEYDRYR